MPTLNWIGKEAVVKHHLDVPFHLLKDVPSLSCGDPGTGNLILQADNLVGLKALLPYYAGEVKCIAIDPPYNTGNEGWAYNDNVKSPAITRWLGEVVGKEGETLDRHDRWLCMMYPRLVLLRQFLREDGAIFVCIDDHEIANLLHLMEEVFGSQNHLATVVWEKGKKGDSKFFSENHEYIVAYARNRSLLVSRNVRWTRRKGEVDRVLAKHSELLREHGSDHAIIRAEMMKWYRSLAKDDPARGSKHYNWSDDRGLYFADNFHGPDDGRESRPRYDIPHPITGKPCAKPSTGWRWEESRTKAALAETPPRIHFGPDESTIPCRKTYLAEASQEPFPTVFYKDGRAATLAVEHILGKGKFAFPKDAEVIADLICIATNPGDLVLDSFGGSGTTAHAVLKTNAANPDKAPRRFIMIEMEEKIAREVTAERVRRVAEGYKNAKGEDVHGLGGGFRFCELGEELFDARMQIRETVKFADLARHVYFIETGEPLPKSRVLNTPFLGVHNGRAVCLLYNGILKDKSPQGGNALTHETLSIIKDLCPEAERTVVYGTSQRVAAARLKREGIEFKQIPYSLT